MAEEESDQEEGWQEESAAYRGYLNLAGLTQLSDAVAESLSKCEGSLWLGGLTELSDAAAESIREWQKTAHQIAQLWGIRRKKTTGQKGPADTHRCPGYQQSHTSSTNFHHGMMASPDAVVPIHCPTN